MRANEFIQEGVNDPAIFKVVFVIGGPGSGKSYVSERLGLGAMGFVTVNSDIAFEYLMKKHSIDPKMPPEEKEKRDTVRARAKEITGKKSDLAIEGRLGIHIDGTGDDYDKIANLKKNFERLGYDAYLVVVNTKLEVARKRNQMRARTVPDKIVTDSWYNVQDNIGRFAHIFTFMSIIDNSGDSNTTEEQISKVHSKLKKFTSEPPSKPAAKQWIQDQKQLDENLIGSLIDKAKGKIGQSVTKLKSILSTETDETKEMVSIIQRLLQGDNTVSDEEKKKATSQFFDIIKLVGLGAFMAYTLKIPFSTEGMLIAAKAVDKYIGINILPSSVKEAQMDEVGKFINAALKKAGYKFIGSGYDAQVWMKDEGTVVKILMPEGQENEAIESFKTFYKFVKSNPSPNLPIFKKVDGREVFRFTLKGKPFMQFGMEQLYPIKEGSLDEWVVWMMADLSAKGMDWDKAKTEMISDSDKFAKEFNAQNTSKMKEYKSLYMTLLKLYKAGMKKGYGWDPHTENVMQRKDGTLVITDPWSV